MKTLSDLSPAERRMLIRLGSPDPAVASIGRRLADMDEWEIDASDALIGCGLARLAVLLLGPVDIVGSRTG